MTELELIQERKKRLDEIEEELDFEVEIEIGAYHTKTKIAKLTPTGIYQYMVWIEKGKDCKSSEVPLWKWDEFRINCILTDERSKRHTKRYIFEFNDEKYEGFDLDEMKEIVAKVSCLNSGSKQIFGHLIYLYCQKYNIEEKEFRDVCGFDDGWILPLDYYIKAETGIISNVKQNVEEMICLNCDKESTIEKVQELYKVFIVDHRDIILAYGMIAPFLYSLKEYTSLAPLLYLHSAKPETGKSTAIKLITKKFWNHLDMLSCTQFNSESRGKDYLSASTFPTGIDEIETLALYAQDLLKSTLTGNLRSQAKDTNQDLKVDRPLTAPPVLSFNFPPEWFEDSTALLSRSLGLELNRRFSIKDKESYTNAINNLVDGEIGKCIIDSTSDLRNEELIRLYEEQPNSNKFRDLRQNTIYKLLHLGANLFERVFKIRLNLSNLEELIIKSSTFGSEDLISLFNSQLDRDKNWIGGGKDVLGNVEKKKWNPPSNAWYKHEVLTHTLQDGTEGFVYCAQNARELARFASKGKLPVNKVRDIVCRRYGEIGEYKSYFVNGNPIRGFFIPEDYKEEEIK